MCAGALFARAPRYLARRSLSAAWKCKECQPEPISIPLCRLIARRRRLSRRLARSCTLLAIITFIQQVPAHVQRQSSFIPVMGVKISPRSAEGGMVGRVPSAGKIAHMPIHSRGIRLGQWNSRALFISLKDQCYIYTPLPPLLDPFEVEMRAD
jgi:hypothetical protein